MDRLNSSINTSSNDPKASEAASNNTLNIKKRKKDESESNSENSNNYINIIIEDEMKNEEEEIDYQALGIDISIYHIIRPLSELKIYQNLSKGNRAKRNCRVKGVDGKACGKKCSFYCKKCSDIDANIIYSLCGPFTGHHCFYFHTHRN